MNEQRIEPKKEALAVDPTCLTCEVSDEALEAAGGGGLMVPTIEGARCGTHHVFRCGYK